MSLLNSNSVAPTGNHDYLQGASAATDFAMTSGNPIEPSPLSQSGAENGRGKFHEEWDASQRGSSIIEGPMQRSNSAMSQQNASTPQSRGGTLKKKASLKRSGSLKRSSSRRSSRAGSVRSLALQPPDDSDEMRSAFFSPVPTTGNPTEILATRFQVWRKVLKDLIAYFKEIQTQYEARSKSLLRVSNIINNTAPPSIFLASGGVHDALQILRDYHKTAIAESNKARDIENDVILALVGLRSDLNQKIKEIKSLSGDFKNSVEKEMDITRRAVNSLQEALGQSDVNPAQMTGKLDPYLLRLAADRQVDKQIDEENYLHQAYLNLEESGRELEAIVVGEIQKSYNAYAGILKREADAAYTAVEELRTGPVAMPKDHEWNSFVENDDRFVDPRIPIRQAQNIYYPGRQNELAQEVRAGLLERKSKYLRSYTAGWYVLSPTHLHEFKSADKTQAPLMSLYLPEQKLGSHSSEGASSNKFMLKGRQTGSIHRGHSWVFRCESHDTMLAWYEDIKTLTEKSPQERNAFVRQHARSVSGTSQKAGSVSSDGVLDEEDDEPFSATASSVVAQGPKQDVLPRRPQPGGRFPSDIQVNTQRGLQAPLSPSSGSFAFGDAPDDDIVAAAALPGGINRHHGDHAISSTYGVNPYNYQTMHNTNTAEPEHGNSDLAAAGPAAAGLGIAGAAVAGSQVYHNHEKEKAVESPADQYQQNQDHIAIAGSPATMSDTFKQYSEPQATYQAPMITPPDTLTPTSSGSKVIPAGHDDVSTEEPNLTGAADLGQVKDVPKTQVEREPLPGASSSTPKDTTARPPLASAPSETSAQSISQFHTPGEFPRGSIVSIRDN